MDSKDSGFGSVLGQALLALAVGALTTIALLFLYVDTEVIPGTTATVKTISGRDFTTIQGATQISDNTLEITALAPFEDGKRAIVVHREKFDSVNYPYLSYQLSGQHPGLQAYLIWRTAEAPGTMSNMRLPWGKGRLTRVKLNSKAQWAGEISEIGIYVEGELRGGPVGVTHLAFETVSWKSAVGQIWSAWTVFRGWNGSSINFLRGTPDATTLSPVIVIATWWGISLLIMFGLSFLRRSHDVRAYGAILLLPWVVLDLFWQQELSVQLEETKYVFSGKTMHEKHLADGDGKIYAYTRRLKEEVLPPTSDSRIFILHAAESMNYQRLKIHYYLLPNNVYNNGTIPPDHGTREGDYILALGDLPALSLPTDRGELLWEGNKTLPVSLVDKSVEGVLYQVRAIKGKSNTGISSREVPRGDD